MTVLRQVSALARRSWHVAALAEEVGDEPVQVWVAGEPWVLVRLDDRLAAFLDRCPHRLAPMSAGRVVAAEYGSARLACGYHGWRYDADGRCDLIPALGKTEGISRRAALAPPAGLAEAYGLVWLAPEPPLAPLPAFPEWDSPGVTRARSASVRTTAGAAQLVDNFLDAAHFPFVHAASFGVDAAEPLAGGVVEREGAEVRASFTTPYRVDSHVASVLVETARIVTHVVTKTVGVGLTVRLRLELPGTTIGILLACTPETATSTRVHKLLTRDDLGDPEHPDGAQHEALQRFVKEEDQILAEDLVILERYASSDLPLDLRAELHTRSDRLSLAWRQLLAEATRGLADPVPPW